MTRRNTSGGLRAFAEKEASALFTSELARRHGEWRTTVASLKQTLTDLAATCDAAMSTSPDVPADAVSQLVENIVAAAARETEAVVQQMEARSQAASAEAQALAERLQAEVRAGQEQLRVVRAQLDAEQDEHARAEAASRDTQVAHERARSALETQLRSQDGELQASRLAIPDLEQRLAAAQAERASLRTTLETLQRAVQGAVSALGPSLPGPSTPGGATPHSGTGGDPATPEPVRDTPISPAAVPFPNGQAADRTDAPELSPDLRPGTGGYVTALLESIEAMYAQDVEAALPPAEIIERLTANLRYAGNLFAERVGSDPAGEKSTFSEQVSKLLYTTSGTAFGRHLSIAACEAERLQRRHERAVHQVPDTATA